MLPKLINNTPDEDVTMNDLFHRAEQLNMRIELDSSSWRGGAEVVLKCSKGGASFSFTGTSSTGVKQAFLNAFKESEIVSMGYE